uniref:Uncharacterized protein n=1 Tax=Pygocentrus nattereri TaxID=42514 RepID=A0AAR2KYR8_PYGNA
MRVNRYRHKCLTQTPSGCGHGIRNAVGCGHGIRNAAGYGHGIRNAAGYGHGIRNTAGCGHGIRNAAGCGHGIRNSGWGQLLQPGETNRYRTHSAIPKAHSSDR